MQREAQIPDRTRQKREHDQVDDQHDEDETGAAAGMDAGRRQRMLAVQGQTGFQRIDRLVLRAVILEHSLDRPHTRDQADIPEEERHFDQTVRDVPPDIAVTRSSHERMHVPAQFVGQQGRNQHEQHDPERHTEGHTAADSDVVDLTAFGRGLGDGQRNAVGERGGAVPKLLPRFLRRADHDRRLALKLLLVLQLHIGGEGESLGAQGHRIDQRERAAQKRLVEPFQLADDALVHLFPLHDDLPVRTAAGDREVVLAPHHHSLDHGLSAILEHGFRRHLLAWCRLYFIQYTPPEQPSPPKIPLGTSSPRTAGFPA